MIKRRLIGVVVALVVGTALGDLTPGGIKLTELKAPTEPIKEGEPYYRGDLSHGNPVWRCQIENTSALPRNVHLTLNGLRAYAFQNSNGIRIGSAFTLDAKESKTVELRLPFISSYLQQMAVEVDDGISQITWGYADGLNMGIYKSWRDPKEPLPRFLDEVYNPLTVVSEELAKGDILAAYINAWKEEFIKQQHLDQDSVLSSRSPYFDLRTCDLTRFTEWRDFSVASAVVVGPKTWAKLTDNVRAALKGYVVAGGSVVLVGEGFPKDAFSVGVHGLGEVAHFKALNAKSPKEGACFADLVANGARNLQFVTNPKEARFPCGVASAAAVEAELGKTPFGMIILVLAIFVLLAGPVLVIYLARTNRRIHLLWMFPTIAVVFTAIVIIVLIAREGTSPRIQSFTHTAKDAEWGMSVTVEDTLIIAPIPVNHAIDLPADALISFDGGDRKVNGEEVVIDESGYHFFGTGWTPSLWPVRFRSVRVEGGAK